MKPAELTVPMLATALLLASTTLFAAETAPLAAASQTATEVGCHSLMTERECEAFQTTLASLHKGKALDQFMSEHTALMREREALCSCNRANAGKVILYPHVKQVAIRS